MTPLVHINAEAHVAAAYGLEEAIFLHSLMFWYRTNRGNGQNFHDGRWWTYNSVKAFEGIFPWWTGAQIRRIITRCREKGAMLAGNYNKDQRDRTAWYTPSDELLELYGERVNCICQNEQMEVPEPTDSFDETSRPLPCSNHVETDNTPYSPPGQSETAGPVVRQSRMTAPTSPPNDRSGGLPAALDKPQRKPRKTRRDQSAPAHNPEAFEVFWFAYPRKDNRKKAIDAWDKLKPGQELCRVMYSALKRQCRDPQWAEEGGKYIPMFSTWLNQRRWENQGVDLSLLSPPANRRGQVKDLEVTQ